MVCSEEVLGDAEGFSSDVQESISCSGSLVRLLIFSFCRQEEIVCHLLVLLSFAVARPRAPLRLRRAHCLCALQPRRHNLPISLSGWQQLDIVSADIRVGVSSAGSDLAGRRMLWSVIDHPPFLSTHCCSEGKDKVLLLQPMMSVTSSVGLWKAHVQ